MRKSAARLTTIWLTVCSVTACSVAACSPAPVVTAVDTTCQRFTRYHATAEQKAAFHANETLWGPLVRWLAGFNEEHRKACPQAPE